MPVFPSSSVARCAFTLKLVNRSMFLYHSNGNIETSFVMPGIMGPLKQSLGFHETESPIVGHLSRDIVAIMTSLYVLQ